MYTLHDCSVERRVHNFIKNFEKRVFDKAKRVSGG